VRGAALVAVAGFGVLTIVFTGTFPPFANPNELSRLETVYAAVELNTFRIDEPIRVLGDHEDKSVSDGHFYSNKAPGLALAAIPVYRALRIFLPAPSRPSDAIFVLLRILTVSLVSVFALSRFGARVCASRAGPLVLFAVAFGSPFLFYARSFFAHAWAAALLYLAFERLTAVEERSRAGFFAGGVLAGWAGISEYTVAPLALLLVLAGGRSLRRLAPAAAGLVLPVLLLLAYNWICFGSPFILSSAREALPQYARLASGGLFGFGAPSPRVALDFLLHPARGLLLFSPFWLWMAPGFVRWFREDRRRAAVAAAAAALLFLLLTAYPNWHGGWGLGNRYLLAALFLAALALPHALAGPLSRGLFAIAAIFSAGLHGVMAATWPHVPADLTWPPSNGALWFLSRGWLAPSLFAGFGSIALLLAAGIVLISALLALSAAVPLRPSRGLAALLSFLMLCGSLALRPEPSYTARLWRAAIYGAYSGLDGERRELAAVVRSASSDRERRQAMRAWALYGPR